MRAFPVRLPSGVRYWTVLDEDLAVVAEADAFLRHVRFGRDDSELTTRSYAGGIALFLRWCVRTGRHWHDGVAALGLFITWLRHAGPQSSGVEVVAGGQVLAGPGLEPVRNCQGESGFRPSMLWVSEAIEAKMSPRGSRFPDNQAGLDGGTRRPTRASDTYRHSNSGVSRCVTA